MVSADRTPAQYVECSAGIIHSDCSRDGSLLILYSSIRALISVALEAYGRISEATLQRAKGWAVLFGVFLLDTGLSDNPRNAGIGARALRRVTESM